MVGRAICLSWSGLRHCSHPSGWWAVISCMCMPYTLNVAASAQAHPFPGYKQALCDAMPFCAYPASRTCIALYHLEGPLGIWPLLVFDAVQL